MCSCIRLASSMPRNMAQAQLFKISELDLENSCWVAICNLLTP